MNAQSPIEPSRNVYAKIAAVQAELATHGISKSRKNKQGEGFMYRGIDEVYNTLSPLLASHGLCVLPRILSREVSERRTRNGGALFVVVVEAEFDFVSADDGSTHTVRTYGEAMDSSDKATNKAMSAAYKYAALMTFAIPTEGDNDADATTHEVAPRREGAGDERSRESEVGHPPADGNITDEQVVKLQSLMQATGTNPGALMLALKAPEGATLNQMPHKVFPQAVELLEQQLADKAKGQSNARFGELLDDEIPY